MDTPTTIDAERPDDCGLPCPVDATLRVLSGRWKAMLLYQLRDGPKHFAALRRRVPEATQRMTTLHLRALERDGLIRRTVIPADAAGRVARVDYALTDKGRSLSPVLEAMAAWGECWLPGDATESAAHVPMRVAARRSG